MTLNEKKSDLQFKRIVVEMLYSLMDAGLSCANKPIERVKQFKELLDHLEQENNALMRKVGRE